MEKIENSHGEIDESRAQPSPKRLQRKKLKSAFLTTALLLIMAGIGLLWRYADKQRGMVEKLKQDIGYQQQRTDDLENHVEHQRQIAMTHSLDALHLKATLLFASYEELQALALDIKAVLRLKQSNIPPKLRNQILFDFREIVAGIHEKNRFEGHRHPVTSLAVSPEGRLLASGGENLRLWNVPLGLRLTLSQVIILVSYSAWLLVQMGQC